jgi:nucleotide-binding universal stress UspA family protein
MPACPPESVNPNRTEYKIMKLDRIVIGIDFSEHSIAAAQWVARALAPRAELVLVHVLELPPPPWFLRSRFSLRPQDVEMCRAGARARLRELGRQVGRGMLWEEVRSGRPEDEVLRVAREYEADLIVVGSHRERTGFWNRFGSTAERILGGSTVPVLVVHGAPRTVPRLVLAAIDDSATGRKVINGTQALAQRLGASGKVLHVLPPNMPYQLSLAGEVVVHDDQYVEAERELVESARAWLAERVEDVPTRLEPTVLLGDTPEAILREARLSGADLLVLGRERKGRIRRHLLGSVTGTVIRGASCPVLVIPSPDHRELSKLDQNDEASSTSADAALDGVVQ